MNKEVAKIIKEKEKEKTFKKFWQKNGYKIFKIIFFPIWLFFRIQEKINKKLNSREIWSESRANEILTYFVPRYSEWDKEEEALFYYNNSAYGSGKRFTRKYIKRKDRRFWRLNYLKILGYLIEKFELEGFIKSVEETYYYNETEIIFKKGI